MNPILKPFKKLSERQGAVWAFLNRKLKKFSKKKKYFPSITISRETGSGGRLVAKQVAKKLGFKYYDKTIVEMLAKESKKRKSLISSLDEKGRSFVEDTVSALFGKEGLSGPAYLRSLIKVILALVRKNSCVILGRGGNFILPSDIALKVRIIAPLKTRIENSVKYEGNTKQKAKEEIKRIHFNRKDFIKRYFGKDISSANYYDLVINTKDISLKQATAIIVKAFRAKSPKI